MNIGIVGLGYWGPNLVRNFLSADGVEKVICFDVQKERMEKVAKKFPMVETVSAYDELLQRKDIAAIALSTPVPTHFPLGLKALEAGKHLLLEKPMAATSEEAEKLIEVAERQKVLLMVDHTFIYTGSVRKIKEIVDRGELGEILYFDSVRVNLGLFQHDTNVLWDLAPHDLSIMDYLIKQKPVAVSAIGISHYNTQEDMAYMTVFFSDKLIAHFHVNWLSPVKVRKILLGGAKHMVVYDDMEASEKVKVYNKGVDVHDKEEVYKTLVQYRIGDMYAPKIDQTEALSLMAAEFVECIRSGKKPTSGGQSGLNIVRILVAADRSMNTGGRMVKL